MADMAIKPFYSNMAISHIVVWHTICQIQVFMTHPPIHPTPQASIEIAGNEQTLLFNICRSTLVEYKSILKNLKKMEDDLSGRRPHWKTTSVEYNLSGRRPQWKMTSVEDNLSGRRPHWKTTSVEDNLSGRQPPWMSASVEDDFSER